MKKMNFTSTLLRLSSLFVLLMTVSVNLMAQGPCTAIQKRTLPISGPGACERVLTPADLLVSPTAILSIRKGAAAQYSLDYKNGAFLTPVTPGSLGITFGKNDLYNEYEIMIMDGGQMCYSYVTPTDESAPIVQTRLSDIMIKCTDLDNGKAPGPEYLGSYIDGASANNRSGEGNITSGEIFNVSSLNNSRYGEVRDCNDFTVRWFDAPAVGDLCPMDPSADRCYYQTIVRTFIFKDKYGNESSITQNITVVSPKIVIPGTLNKDGKYVSNFTDCTKNNDEADLPYIDWNFCDLAPLRVVKKDKNETAGTEVMINGKDYCGWSIQTSVNPAMQLCAGSRMLTRTYKIKPCHPMSLPYTVDHIINIWDRTSPNVKLEYTDYLRVKEEQCTYMNGQKVINYVYKTVRAEGGGSVEGIRTKAAENDATGQTKSKTTASFKVTPLVNTGTCDEATVRIKLSADDLTCSKGDVVLTSDGGLLFNGMTTMKLTGGGSVTVTGSFATPFGFPDIEKHIFVTDDCGNETDIKLTIVILDNLAPNSYCEDKQMALNNKGEVLVAPWTFSSSVINTFGYTDNCPILVNPNTTMDRGMFIRRTGSNDCWSRTLLLTCADGESVKVDIRTIDDHGNYTDCCVTATLVNKVGPSCQSFMDVSTVCTDPKLASLESFFTQPTYYAPCGDVAITSTTPTLNLSCGAGSATKTWTFTNNGQSVQCKQTLTVTSIPGYRVLPLADSVATCNYIYNEAVERGRALDRVRLLNGDGIVTCAAPIVEVEKWEYSNTQFCKIIRIRYSFVDKCQRYQGLDPIPGNYVNFDQNGNKPYFQHPDGYYQARQVADGNGFAYVFGFERYIMVNDRVAPTSVPPTVADICIGDNCKFTFAQTLEGSDLCNDGSKTGSNLSFNWSVVSPSGSVIATGNSATVSHAARATGSLSDLAAGTYTVNYSVADFCGNRSFYSYKVTGKDCKAPWILVHEKNLELGYDSRLNMGMGEACVIDVLNNFDDNCTGKEYLFSKMRMQRASEPAVYSETLSSCVQFTCADKGNKVAVRVWTRDEAGNTNFVLTYVTVQDNKNACSATPLAAITGTLKTENGQAVNNAVVSASVNGTVEGTGNTDAAGSYALTATLDQNVTVKAVKIATEDKYAGVTTFDIARISKHLLDIEKFTSPYSMIAADVNKDGEIDATDMLQIRNFILKKSTSLPGGVWRFIDKSYKFTNAANPFGEDFPEVVNLSKVPATATANFVAVKLGDVNTTYVANLTGVQVRNSNALVLQAQDMQLVAGNEYTVDITADNFNAIAFQGTISMNGATVKSVKAGDLANYNDGNFGVFANDVTTSWNGASKLNANVMSITFVANKNAKLSEVMTVGSGMTPAVANDAQGNEMNVNLKFTTGKVSGGEFALYQNTPNPVALETTIGFNLPKDEQARLTVYTVDGKTILAKQIDGKAGANQVTINKSELNANGVMYYRLETAEHTATKKMVIIE